LLQPLSIFVKQLKLQVVFGRESGQRLLGDRSSLIGREVFAESRLGYS
jgi:hypothetical protein